MDGSTDHWEQVYRDRDPTGVSWYESVPSQSLELIEAVGLDRSAAILDIGGGASSLAAHLMSRGYLDLSVADLSEAALGRARAALGSAAERVAWIAADVRVHDFARQFDLWHDRAVFHFMVDAGDRAGYVSTLRNSLARGGEVIIATFGPDGPSRCSGLSVQRYGAAQLHEALGEGFEPISSLLVDHPTPSGNHQQFLYARFRLTSD